jgi:hypothetical protein
MRCPKCGYISFDHLDQCQKCRTDLSRERIHLNLLNTPANPISLLAIVERMSATRAHEEPAREKEKTLVKRPAPTVEEWPEIDMTREFDSDGPPASPSGPPKEEKYPGLSMEKDDPGPGLIKDK